MSLAKFIQTAFLVGAVAILAARPAHAETETILYNFTNLNGDGWGPQAGLISEHQGNFYGTTTDGGSSGSFGTVFELSPDGSGGWNETVLYHFTGGADGAHPVGPLTFDGAENLYGTTFYSGAFNKGQAGRKRSYTALAPTGTA